MSCQRAQQIDLAEYLLEPRSAAFDEFREHYPTCAACSAAVARFTQLEHELRAGAEAGSHPEPEQLARWHGDRAGVPADERDRLALHLEHCAPCRDELRALRGFDPAALAPAAMPAEPAQPATAATRPWWRRLAWSPALAVALVAVALAPFLYRAVEPGGTTEGFRASGPQAMEERDDRAAGRLDRVSPEPRAPGETPAPSGQKLEQLRALGYATNAKEAEASADAASLAKRSTRAPAAAGGLADAPPRADAPAALPAQGGPRPARLPSGVEAGLAETRRQLAQERAREVADRETAEGVASTAETADAVALEKDADDLAALDEPAPGQAAAPVAKQRAAAPPPESFARSDLAAPAALPESEPLESHAARRFTLGRETLKLDAADAANGVELRIPIPERWRGSPEMALIVSDGSGRERRDLIRPAPDESVAHVVIEPGWLGVGRWDVLLVLPRGAPDRYTIEVR